MRIEVTTDGGFTGRGIGSVAVDAGVALQELLDRVEPEVWGRDHPASGADRIRFTLTAGSRSVTWAEGWAMPAGLQALFDEVWERRA